MGYIINPTSVRIFRAALEKSRNRPPLSSEEAAKLRKEIAGNLRRAQERNMRLDAARIVPDEVLFRPMDM
ncbi:MAG: hypothetical protein WC835_02245 [Candidatus Paceibacterota bacterium]